MVNKILPKDINLLLNKLIIIIRKISVSCGKKNKKLTKGAGGFLSGLPSIYSTPQDKNLETEINSFITSDYRNSLSFFNNLNLNYFENPDKFFIKENINPKNTRILNNTNIANYRGNEPTIDTYIQSMDQSNLDNRGYDFAGKNAIIYKNYKGEIKYITFESSITTISNYKDIMIYHVKYILLYNKIYNTYDNKNIKFKDLQEIVVNYINFYKNLKDTSYIDKIKDTSYIDKIKDDSIITFYNYVFYILTTVNKLIKNYDYIDIDLLRHYQNIGGKKDLVILKHAAIINIGTILISILKTLKNIS